MASPSSRGDDAHDAHDASRNGPRHWNPYEMQAICALVCKGAHLKGSMSFATKLNKTLNGNGSYKDDIDIEDVEELLEHIETKKKAALAFIERQGQSRITRTQRRVFERNLGFDGTLSEWDGGRKEKVMQARQAREVREGSPDGETKGEQFTAADGTRIDRWTPSMRGETAQPNARVFNNAQTDDGMVEGGSTATQPVGMQDNVLLTRQVAHRTPNHADYPRPTPVWGNPNRTQPPGRGTMPGPADMSAAWRPRRVVSSQGPTPPWRLAQQPTGNTSTHSDYQYAEATRYLYQQWGPTYESSERK